MALTDSTLPPDADAGTPLAPPAVRDKRLEHYPGLIVMDGRVTGSITIGNSRLPVWCIPHRGFSIEAHTGEPTAYGVTDHDLATFVHMLLEQRGAWGRLICIVADEERISRRTGWPLPPSKRAKKRMRAALQECIDDLEHPWLP